MTIDKAIEILSDSANRGMTTFNQDYKEAQKLGIEALKVVQSNRIYGYPNKIPKLPGETEE